MLNIEYQSTCILIMSSCDEFVFIVLDENKPKIKKWNTWWEALTNKDVEEIFKEILDDENYDIEYEIEEYRNSRLYNDLKCNDEEE